MRNEDEKIGTYRAYGVRWYCLALFTLNSFSQSALWMTFSGIPDATKEYFAGCDDFHVTLLLAWGPIIFIPVTFLLIWMDAHFNNFRYLILCATILSALGTIVRIIPTFFCGPSNNGGLWLMHLGQILNGSLR